MLSTAFLRFWVYEVPLTCHVAIIDPLAYSLMATIRALHAQVENNRELQVSSLN